MVKKLPGFNSNLGYLEGIIAMGDIVLIGFNFDNGFTVVLDVTNASRF